ncbi:hypothetical protein AX289_30030 [Methylorubrum populi]|nr:hypothetical protein AX289_30030 [Methylorubrum populi]
MLKATILILYLASSSASTGMTVTTAEFATPEACEFAGQQSKAKLGSWGTSAYWVCAPKGEPMPAVPQAR